MEKIIHRFSLDVNKNGVQRTIQGIETGERYARELRITLRNGKENYEIPSDDSVKAVMYIRKPSSEIVSVNDCTIEGDEIVYLLGAEDVSVAGTIIMQLKVIGSLRGGAEAVLVSPRFNLEVWESETDDSGAESTDTFTALENALAQAQIAYSGRVTHVEIDEDYLITVTFNNGQTYESDALQQMSDKIKKIDESVEALDTKIDGKADKVDPTTSGTFTHNGDAKMEDIDAHIIKATSLKYMESDGYHIVANEIKTLNDKDASLRNELTYVEGSVSKTTQELKEEIESASGRAEDAYNLASRANREAASAINLANDNKAKIDLHTGLIGEGVGSKEVPTLGYTDGYYIAPNGRVTQYNATATVISIDFLDFFFNGDNIIFNHVDLLPTENCIPCAWYDISGNFISAADGLNIIAEIDEQTFKITKQYIDYCIIPIPAGANSCKMSGLANGRADIRIQTSLSEAIKDLQSKPETVPLVLTNPSPLTTSAKANILGIHAKGKSEQIGNYFEQGGIGHTTNANYSANKVSSNTRIRSAELMPTVSGQTYNFTCNSAYKVIVQSFNESGLLVDTSGSNAWNNPLTVTASASMGIAVCKADNSNITPSDATSANILVNGSSIFAPTPTSPIPIVDASEEVTAIGKNLFDKSIQPIKSYIEGNNNRLSENASANTFIVPIKADTTYTVSSVVKDGSRLRIASAPTEMTSGALDNIARGSTSSALTITTQSSDAYLYVNIKDGTDIASIVDGLQIEEGTTATAYTEYASNTITLPYTLKSVGNVADELVVNEDGSGQIVRRVGTYTFNGTESWTWITSDKSAWVEVPQLKKVENYIGSMLCDRFTTTTNHNTLLSAGDGITGYYDSSNKYTTNWIYLRYSSATTLDALKTWLASNPITVYYILATPIETPLTAEQVTSIRQLQTYKGTTVIESEMQIDSVTYSGDVKGYVDSKIDYSYTDTIIGKWADGKDLHRMVIQTTTPSTADTASYVSRLVDSSKCSIKNYYGCFLVSGIYISINYGYDEKHSKTNIDAYGISMTVSSGYINSPCEIVVEYTLKEESGIALLSEGEVVANE